jgi:hypothetical protein
MPENRNGGTNAPSLEAALKLKSPVVADARELEIEVTLRNVGASAIRVDTLPMEYGPAVLRLRAASEEPIPLVPPSVPPLDDDEALSVQLAPGEEISFQYRGGGLLDSPLPRGTYAVRFQLELTSGPSGRDWAGELVSSWVPFEVTGG